VQHLYHGVLEEGGYKDHLSDIHELLLPSDVGAVVSCDLSGVGRRCFVGSGERSEEEGDESFVAPVHSSAWKKVLRKSFDPIDSRERIRQKL